MVWECLAASVPKPLSSVFPVPKWGIISFNDVETYSSNINIGVIKSVKSNTDRLVSALFYFCRTKASKPKLIFELSLSLILTDFHYIYIINWHTVRVPEKKSNL